MTLEFKSIALAAIAPQDEEYVFETPFGRRTHRRRLGEALHSEREPLEVLEAQRRSLGHLFFSAQYQQAPVQPEGNLLKRAWLKFYMGPEAANPDRVIQSWDVAAKEGQLNDFSVCSTWATKGPDIYLLDLYRERIDTPTLRRKIVELSYRFNASQVLIEDKGTGIGLLQDLRRAFFYKAKGIDPKGSKVFRFQDVTTMIENGLVYFPQAAPWLDAYLHELCSFPSTRHDDQVDSTSQALAWIRGQAIAGAGLREFYRQEAEATRAFTEDRTVHLRAPAGVSHVYLIDGTVLSVDPDGTVWVTADAAGPLVGSAGFVRLN